MADPEAEESGAREIELPTGEEPGLAKGGGKSPGLRERIAPYVPTKRKLVWWTVGGVAVVGGLWWLAHVLTTPEEEDEKLPAKGRPVCPVDPAPTAGIRPGDYLILTLADRALVFREMVWAQVLSRAPEGDRFLVRLLGRMGETGPVDLAKKKHGFRIGEQLKVDADCVWDTMHAPDVGGKGQLYCGFDGENLLDEPPILVKDLREGDEVKVVVSTIIGSEAHADALWTRVDGISRTGNVVYGTIVSPIQFPIHGFRQWQEIEFGRDCVFDRRRP